MRVVPHIYFNVNVCWRTVVLNIVQDSSVDIVIVDFCWFWNF